MNATSARRSARSCLRMTSIMFKVYIDRKTDGPREQGSEKAVRQTQRGREREKPTS